MCRPLTNTIRCRIRWKSKNRLKRWWGATKYREIFADVFDHLEQCTRDLTLAVVVENGGSLELTNRRITEAFQAEGEQLDLISAKLDMLMEIVAGELSVTTTAIAAVTATVTATAVLATITAAAAAAAAAASARTIVTAPTLTTASTQAQEG